MSDNVRAAERVMNQTAVYWEKIGDSQTGDPIFDTPVEIACYWIDVHEQFVSRAGKDVVSNSKVIVDRDLIEDSQLWLGELKNVESQSDPSENKGHYAIAKFEKIPDRKAQKFLRMVML